MEENFLIKKISENTIEQELNSIGFDSIYLNVAKNKYQSNLLKIYNLTPVQATILKQTALSCGTDCAVHKEILTHKVEFTDAILFATNMQLKEIVKKLYAQPFNLKTLAQNLEAIQNISPVSLKIRETKFNWNKTYIMGILNCTPNSFSDGGEFLEQEKAIPRFVDLIEQGADIVDIGAESTAPFSVKINPEEEILRLENILSKCRKLYPNIPISVDTRNSITAEMALEKGADIINDVSGFFNDAKMPEIVAKHKAYCILTFDDKIESGDIIDETIKGLLKRIQIAFDFGITKEKIIIDPGLGFNKTFEQNYELIKRANEICSLGFPVLYGLSRKSFIQKVTDLKPKETLCANISLATYLAEKGVQIVRVHDVIEHKIAFKALNKVLYD